MSVRLSKDVKFSTALKGYALKVSTSNTNSSLLINISFEEIFEKFYCPMNRISIYKIIMNNESVNDV